MELILFNNVKMPTIVGILAFISMINTDLKQGTPLFVGVLVFYEQLKFHPQLSKP